MFMHKKNRIQNMFDNKNMDHLEKVNQMNENDVRKREMVDEEITKEMLGAGQNMGKYERLSEEYGHRRYIRQHVSKKYNRVY